MISQARVVGKHPILRVGMPRRHSSLSIGYDKRRSRLNLVIAAADSPGLGSTPTTATPRGPKSRAMSFNLAAYCCETGHSAPRNATTTNGSRQERSEKTLPSASGSWKSTGNRAKQAIAHGQDIREFLRESLACKPSRRIGA